MKLTFSRATRALLLAFVVFAVGASSVYAQEYKKTYNAGLEAAKAKNYQEAYQHFANAAKLAQEAGDEQVAQRANKLVAQLDYNFGKALSDKENFEQALVHFEKGITALPSYLNNYLGKAVALKKLDRNEDAVDVYLAMIKLGEDTGSEVAKRKGEQSLRDHYIFLASSALGRSAEPTRSDAQAAIGYLEGLQEHLELEADGYYYLAAANHALGNYDEAIQMADQALEMHRGSKTDKAKIFFIKGEALMYQGNTAMAKTAFQEATYGSYKSLAEHYLETL